MHNCSSCSIFSLFEGILNRENYTMETIYNLLEFRMENWIDSFSKSNSERFKMARIVSHWYKNMKVR